MSHPYHPQNTVVWPQRLPHSYIDQDSLEADYSAAYEQSGKCWHALEAYTEIRDDHVEIVQFCCGKCGFLVKERRADETGESACEYCYDEEFWRAYEAYRVDRLCEM